MVSASGTASVFLCRCGVDGTVGLAFRILLVIAALPLSLLCSSAMKPYLCELSVVSDYVAISSDSGHKKRSF